MATMFDEDGMSCCDQGGVLFVSISGIEWDTEYKTVRFDRVLVHCSFVPDLIRGTGVEVTEVTVKEER